MRVAYKRIGVVLSSGGGRGVYGHTGFLLALGKLNIKIDAMSGCSAGAVVGSIAASGGNVKDWSKALAEVSSSQFWTPGSRITLLYRLIGQAARELAPCHEISGNC